MNLTVSDAQPEPRTSASLQHQFIHNLVQSQVEPVRIPAGSIFLSRTDWMTECLFTRARFPALTSNIVLSIRCWKPVAIEGTRGGGNHSSLRPKRGASGLTDQISSLKKKVKPQSPDVIVQLDGN